VAQDLRIVSTCGECDVLAVSPFHAQLIAGRAGRDLVGVTIHGPSGQNVSIALQNEKTPERISRRWMSRAVMSLKIT
jgi:hypothetical protein